MITSKPVSDGNSWLINGGGGNCVGFVYIRRTKACQGLLFYGGNDKEYFNTGLRWLYSVLKTTFYMWSPSALVVVYSR